LEALILAGGKAERLGDAAEGRPKPLVLVGGRPIAAYQVARLVEAGVRRVILSVAAGNEALFDDELSGLGAEIVAVGEPEPLGRGGGLRLAAQQRQSAGPVLALNGDELLGVDLGELLERHRQCGGAATIVVSRVRSAFGVVELGSDDAVAGFREAPLLPQWVNSGVYVLDEEAIARLPERGDHEDTTFPELAREGKLFAYRNEGYWLTVNTPKQLREAEAFMQAHPELAPREPAELA
jgi:NDP-sugar pyrophosphorylase family protein